MPKQQRKQPNSAIRITGNVDTGGGDIAAGNISKGDVNQTHISNTTDIEKLFLPIYKSIDGKQDLLPEEKDDLRAAVEEIQSEVGKKSNVLKEFVERRLRNIARMAPDILDLVLKTIANPAIGLTDFAYKISSRANAETISTEGSKKKAK